MPTLACAAVLRAQTENHEGERSMSQERWVVAGKGFSDRISGKLLTHCFIMMFLN